MGFRRFRGLLGQEELAVRRRAYSSSPFFDQRRITLRGWCGVAFFALLLPACNAPRAEIAAPQQVLVIGHPEGPGVKTRSGAGQVVESLALEGLTQLATDGRTIPRLAKSWEWSDDGLTLRVMLRPDITLHDRRPLNSATAAEILKSIIADKDNHGLFPALADITAVETDGDFGLTLILSRYSSFLPEDLSIPFGTASEPPIGAGPYSIVQRSDKEVVLERFESYYLGKPAIARVVVRPIETLRTGWASLMRGALDMVTDLPPETVELIRNDNIQVVSFSRRYQYMVAFNSKHPKFLNPAVRRALNMAIDRDSLVKNVLHGYGTPATGPIWPKHWAYDSSIEAFGFNVGESTMLLEAAGLVVRASSNPTLPPARLRFTCILPTGFSIYERLGLDIQRQLYEVGVDLQFEVLPFETYDRRIRSGDFEAAFVDMISAPSLGRPFIFWRSARQTRGYNVFGYENPEAEEHFRALRASTTDLSVRNTTHRLQRVFMNDPPAIFLAWNERSRAVRSVFGVLADTESDPLLSLWRWGADNQPGR